METFGKFMAIVIAMVLSPIINGFVFVRLWAWFIIPLFELRPLRIIEAIGLILIINYVRAKRSETNNEAFWDEFGKNVIFIISYAALALFAGWIISLFM